MDPTTDKRRTGRVRARFDALYSSGRQEGAGVLVDVSYGGARVENSSIRPEIGTQVRVYVFVQPVSPFELVGTVVRHSDSGFAIEYKDLDSEVRRLINEVVGIMSAPD
jgi:hypothetical protein